MSEENVEFVRNLYAMIDRGNAQAWICFTGISLPTCRAAS